MTVLPPLVHSVVHTARVVCAQGESSCSILYAQVRSAKSNGLSRRLGSQQKTARGAWWNTLDPGLTTRAIRGLPMVSSDHIAAGLPRVTPGGGN